MTFQHFSINFWFHGDQENQVMTSGYNFFRAEWDYGAVGIFDIHQCIEITQCLQCNTLNQSDVLKSYGLCNVSMYFLKTSNQ